MVENKNDITDAEREDTEKRKKEDLSMLYKEAILKIEEGQILKGKIISISQKDVLVDIGYKSEGVISLSEFQEPDSIKVGDEIDVYLESKEDDNGMVVLSKLKAERVAGWDKVISKCGEGDVVEGKVTKKVKGGFMVDIGVEAFLPASLAALRNFGNLYQFIGQTFPFKVVKINKLRKNIVLSRRDALQQQKEGDRKKAFEGLQKGAILSGVVRNITDFGAFVDLGAGITGLLHITDMSWGRVSHPSELLAIGDKLDVVVLDFDKDNNRVSLGLKQKTQNPWDVVDVKYPVGSKIKGTVVNLVPYGAFVELEKGVEGLLHISELSWTKKYNHPNELLAIGDRIEVQILDVDKQNRKISLGLKQLEANPWADVDTKYPVGTKVKGKIRNMTDYGLFVELEDGIDGLVHVSDISWTKRVGHPKDVFKKGEKVEAVVLAVDSANRRISLGIRQLTPDPWDEIAARFLTDAVLTGKIAKAAHFGLFVEIEKDLEGLVHISEIPLAEGEKLEEKFKVGDEIKVKVLKVDSIQHKIALTLKNV
ncbi:MAG: 30S ribosomal protein S1 [Omnitrophica bacterium RIFCSPLOWO2_01_FULL_45_10]|nr:MAG: 30S ribosomal protein S1 [Omnitrophica bacterium RIFCSPLOWO2_01_FULL_45_10]